MADEQARPSSWNGTTVAGGLSWDGSVWLLADLVPQTGYSHADVLSLSGSWASECPLNPPVLHRCHLVTLGPVPVHLLPIPTGRACASWALLPLCSPCFSCTSFIKKFCYF